MGAENPRARVVRCRRRMRCSAVYDHGLCERDRCPTSTIQSTGVIERQKLVAMAESLTDPEAKQRMLKVAADYEKLAERAEERSAGVSRSLIKGLSHTALSGGVVGPRAVSTTGGVWRLTTAHKSSGGARVTQGSFGGGWPVGPVLILSGSLGTHCVAPALPQWDVTRGSSGA